MAQVDSRPLLNQLRRKLPSVRVAVQPGPYQICPQAVFKESDQSRRLDRSLQTREPDRQLLRPSRLRALASTDLCEADQPEGTSHFPEL